MSDAVHARHVWWTGSVEGLLYLQRGARSFLLPFELGRLCDETLLEDVLFQNVCIHNLQADKCLLILRHAINSDLVHAMNANKCCIYVLQTDRHLLLLISTRKC